MATRITTKAALARELGLTRGRISQYIASGMPVLPDGRVDVSEAKRWVAENVVRPDRVTSEGYHEAKRIDAIFRAKLMWLAYERRASALVERAAVRKRLDSHFSTLRAGLAAMTDRLAPQLAGERDAKRVHVLLRDALVVELTRLADVIGGDAMPECFPRPGTNSPLA